MTGTICDLFTNGITNPKQYDNINNFGIKFFVFFASTSLPTTVSLDRFVCFTLTEKSVYNAHGVVDPQEFVLDGDVYSKNKGNSSSLDYSLFLFRIVKLKDQGIVSLILSTQNDSDHPL